MKNEEKEIIENNEKSTSAKKSSAKKQNSKEKKEPKTISAKKLPKIFKKRYLENSYKKKILKKVYVASDKNESGLNERLVRMFSETVISISYAYNQIIIKTLSASASIAAETIDSLQWPEILGTIAGENTILMIVRSVEEVKSVVDRLNTMIRR